MADLQAKYQKLASEYSKLRAQIPVLKKAVLDEQTKEEDLKERIKGKDQSIRKFEQEIDSLTFRNQQLTSRVSVLQQELEESKYKKKNSKKQSVPQQLPSPDGASIIGEELQSKIEENARLHKQVYESSAQHEQDVMQLRDRLTILESEASRHDQVMGATKKEYKDIIERLQEDKAMLEVKLQKQETIVSSASQRAEVAEQRLAEVESTLRTELNHANKIIEQKLQFNDTRMQEITGLNLPTHDRKHQLKTKELMTQAHILVKELTQALSNFHTYCEQRSRIYPLDEERETLSDVNKALCRLLHENASYLRPLEQSFKIFQESIKDDALTTLETASGLFEFSEKMKKYVSYADKLLPYQLLSLEEENSMSSCTSTLAAKNMELHKSFTLLFSTLTKIETYISLLASQSLPNCDHPKTSHPKMFELLAKSVTDFHEATKEISKHYSAKVSLEHQLPTATHKLKTTDECIVSSLVALVTCSTKIHAFLTRNLEFLCTPSSYTIRGVGGETSEDGPRCHPCVTNYRHRAAQYMTNISRPQSESVPYCAAIQNRKTLLSSTESRDSLNQQVLGLKDKVHKLEQEKEHWSLELQLLNVKYEKETQKVIEYEKKLKGVDVRASDSSEGNLEAGESKSRPNSQIAADFSMLGELTSVAQDDREAREDLIKAHFAYRIGELFKKVQMADSKAMNFQAECRALQKQLVIKKGQSAEAQTNLAAASKEIAQLKDELQTTTRNYEQQLSMMSEHLAGMNDKLAKQKDEIDMLRYQIQNTNSKTNKKGKGK